MADGVRGAVERRGAELIVVVARMVEDAVRTRGVSPERERPLPGLLHLGPRPTFAGFAPTVELWLMDYDADLYGQRVRVELVQRIRDIHPFTTVDALVAAMKEDERAGREMLAR